MPRHYRQIYEALYRYYGPQNWWPADTPLEMMIGAILVQNTSWHNASMALTNLKPYLTPEQMEALTHDELARLIQSSGFYNIKAKRIKAFLAWYKTYDYNIDKLKRADKQQLRRDMLTIKGIGRETADVILIYMLDKPLFVVDQYARRIFYRLGFNMPEPYDAFRREVEEAMSGDWQLFNEFHALLVEHAKSHCKKTPICKGCPLLDVCEQRLDD